MSHDTEEWSKEKLILEKYFVTDFRGKKISRFRVFFAKLQNLIPANIKIFFQPQI